MSIKCELKDGLLNNLENDLIYLEMAYNALVTTKSENDYYCILSNLYRVYIRVFTYYLHVDEVLIDDDLIYTLDSMVEKKAELIQKINRILDNNFLDYYKWEE